MLVCAHRSPAQRGSARWSWFPQRCKEAAPARIANCCGSTPGMWSLPLIRSQTMCAIASNDWTKDLATKGGPELQQLYDLLGAHDNVQITPLLQFPHNFNYVSRGVMYGWMNKHLKLGLTEPVVEEDFVPLSKEEMTVWDDKHPPPPPAKNTSAACCAP